MSFEKILYKLRDAWRGDIKRSLEGLPGYYWGEVTGPGEVLLDAVAPGSAPVPVDDLVGALVGDRVLLVLVDGAFSVVGVAGRGVPASVGWVEDQIQLNGVPRFATTAARDAAFPAPVDGQVCYVTGNGYYVRDGGVWRTVLDDTGWQNLTMLNGWTGSQTPAVRRINGVVYFRGEVYGTNTGIGSPAFILPAGFRPPTRTRTAIGFVSETYSVMGIETDGTVWFTDPRSGTPGWALGAVQFVAEI